MKRSKRTQKQSQRVFWPLDWEHEPDIPAGQYSEILSITGGVPARTKLVSHGPVVRLDSRGNPIPWEPKTVSWNLRALKGFIRQFVRLGKEVGLYEEVKAHPSHVAGTLTLKKSAYDFQKFCERYRPLIDLIERHDDMRTYYHVPGLINARPRAKKLLQALAAALAGHHSKGIGAPKGTRSLTPTEQKHAEKMRRRGKGTEKGSVRMIASTIGENRDYSLSTEGRKVPALARTLKRYFRRKRI